MYYLHKWPILLREKFRDNSFFIHSNDRDLIAIVTSCEVAIYHTKSKLLIAKYSRSLESMQQYGNSVCALWKTDASSIALGTELGFVILLSIEDDDSNQSREYYHTILNVTNSQHSVTPASSVQKPSASILRLSDVITFETGITSMDHYYNDMIISTTNGCIYRMDWAGKPMYSQTLRLDRVLFYFDLEHSKAGRIEEVDIFCQQLEWMPTFQGIFILLTNGKAALLCLSSGRLDIGQIEGVWATHLKYAICMAGNNRYRVMAFGGRNGEGALFSIDDMTGSLVLIQRLKISPKENPEAQHVTGAVCAMHWSPDWSCLAMVWERGGFALWSTFGSLLFSTLGERVSACRQMTVFDVAWGAEGYSLWLLTEQAKSSSYESSKSDAAMEACDPEKASATAAAAAPVVKRNVSLLVYNLIRSCLTTSLTMYNHNHILLLSSDTLFISTRRDIVAGKVFQGFPYPDDYMRCYWPVKFAAIDELGERVAIAGRRGFTHCSLHLRKWKLFGNETQEGDLEVCGGMTWWHDYLFIACYSQMSDKFLLRAYPTTERLDNSNCTEVHVDDPVLQVNSFRETVLTLSVKATVCLYEIKVEKNSKSPSVKLLVEKRQTIDISSCIAFPTCIIAISLTGLRSEIVRKDLEKQKSEAESILINYAGRVLLFQRDRSGKLLQGNTEPYGYRKGLLPSGALHSRKTPLPFCAPIVVASSVELMWCTPFSSLAVTAASNLNTHLHSHHLHPHHQHSSAMVRNGSSPGHHSPDPQNHLTDTLWLNCGAHGMRVWLPLLFKDSRTPGFMSRRIMLPFFVETYPLAVLVEEALFVGVVNDFSHPLGQMFRPWRCSSSSSGAADADNAPISTRIPYAQIEKHSEIYLHQVIKQLLRKNLGVNALELSLCCRHLSYFPHVLELLLHEVLEEEATSKEPIPDPLLPRVVAFIQEFPEFLDTVAHCARKTEVALWPHLFSIVGQPKELFENCLVSGELDIAASYLIILQNMEKPIMSKQHALLLLSSALEKHKWKLVEDLIRFLQAIDPRDMADFNAELGRQMDYTVGNDLNFVGSSLYKSTSSAISARSGWSGGGGAAATAVPANVGSKWPSLLQSLNTPPSSPPTAVAPDDVFHISPDSSDKGNELISPDDDTGPLSSSLGSMTLQSMSHSLRTAGGGSAAPRHNSVSMASPTTAHTNLSLRKDRIDVYSLTDEVTRILHNHARYLLMNYRVYELAEFASNTPFHNKQFISWLQREADRAGAVKNFFSALHRLHEDFHWPFPLQLTRASSRTTEVDSNNPSFRVGLPPTRGILSSSSSSQGLSLKSLSGDGPEVALLLQAKSPEEVLVASSSSLSAVPCDAALTMNNSSSHGDNESESDSKLAPSSHTPIIDMSYRREIEAMSHELANRGSEKALVQLRYLHKIFVEAQCLDWCVLIGILLRDPLSISRDLAEFGIFPPLEKIPSPAPEEKNLRFRIQRGLWELYDWSLLHSQPYMRLLEPFLCLDNESHEKTEEAPHHHHQQQQQVLQELPSQADTSGQANHSEDFQLKANNASSTTFNVAAAVCELPHENREGQTHVLATDVRQALARYRTKSTSEQDRLSALATSDSNTAQSSCVIS